MSEKERELGLTTVRNPGEMQRRQPTSGEREMMARTGEESTKLRLQKAIDEASADRPTMSEPVDRPEDRGVTCTPNIRSSGRVSGMSYELDGQTKKGSDLGKACTFSGQQSWRGLRARP